MTSARDLCKRLPLQPPRNTLQTDSLSQCNSASQLKLSLKHVIMAVHAPSSSPDRKKRFDEVAEGTWKR